MSWFVGGDGPPLVMIQGAGVGGTGWRPQVEALSGEFRCLCYDNRGFGESPWPKGDLTLELMAEDLLALMDAQGWESAHLMGHSMGGLIALYAAHKARARVRSLSLLCTFASGAVPSRLTPWLLGVGLRSRIGTRRMRRHAFLEMVLAPGELAQADRDALAERLGDLFGHDLADQPPVVLRQIGAMRRADATPFLAGMGGIPSLVISATHDRMAPPFAGRVLAEGIPGARYVELPDAAHGVPITHADRVNALLREHLKGAEAAWRPQPRAGTGAP
ncbi:MAG TPA: alpha/beta hydrolase [Longimicrobium sp.]|nr:alpha/beta hydrolase [Longimicrobium sp.]